MWGPILALLYLSRTPTANRRAQFNQGVVTTDANGGYLQSPLIGTLTDYDSAESEHGSLRSRSAMQARILAQAQADSSASYNIEASIGSATTDPEAERIFSPEQSMQYQFRDTVTSTASTSTLPSELNFLHIKGSNPIHYYDFSYRGEEDHNIHFR